MIMFYLLYVAGRMVLLLKLFLFHTGPTETGFCRVLQDKISSLGMKWFTWYLIFVKSRGILISVKNYASRLEEVPICTIVLPGKDGLFHQWTYYEVFTIAGSGNMLPL